MEDTKIQALCDTILTMAAPAFIHNITFFLFMMCRLTNLIINHGIGVHSAPAFAWTGNHFRLNNLTYF